MGKTMTTPSGMDDEAVIHGVELRLDTLIAGLTSHLPAGTTSIVVNGVSCPIADLIKQAQEANRPYKEKRAARATLRQHGLTREDDRKVALDLLADYEPAIVALLGRENVQLTLFGFSPKTPRKKLTSEQAVLRAAKAKVTRDKHRAGKGSTPDQAPGSNGPAGGARTA